MVYYRYRVILPTAALPAFNAYLRTATGIAVGRVHQIGTTHMALAVYVPRPPCVNYLGNRLANAGVAYLRCTMAHRSTYTRNP